MCGRLVVARSVSEILEIFEADEVIGEEPPRPSYNLTPTQQVAIVVDRAFERDESGSPVGELRREIHFARWGLVPRWAKEVPSSNPLHNARIETVSEKPSFKGPLLHQRAAIPVDGYFEWQVREDGSKQPFFIHAGSDGMFAMAGLFEWWLDPSKDKTDPARWLLSCTMLTKAPAPELAHIHDRNPVMLSAESLEPWLDQTLTASDELLDFVASEAEAVAALAEFHPVSPEVGSIRNNHPGLIAAI